MQTYLPWQADSEPSLSLLPQHAGPLQQLVVVLVVLAGLATDLSEGPVQGSGDSTHTHGWYLTDI